LLSKITAFFERHLQPAGGASAPLSQPQKQLAIAALLIEVAMADHICDECEIQSLKVSLKNKFSIDVSQIDELIELAKEESSESTSLHQFTSLVHQHCNPTEKFELLVAMWQLAFSDSSLNKYEEYVIRKVADLIYVPHSEFMRAKSAAKAT